MSSLLGHDLIALLLPFRFLFGLKKVLHWSLKRTKSQGSFYCEEPSVAKRKGA